MALSRAQVRRALSLLQTVAEGELAIRSIRRGFASASTQELVELYDSIDRGRPVSAAALATFVSCPQREGGGRRTARRPVFPHAALRAYDAGRKGYWLLDDVFALANADAPRRKCKRSKTAGFARPRRLLIRLVEAEAALHDSIEAARVALCDVFGVEAGAVFEMLAGAPPTAPPTAMALSQLRDALNSLWLPLSDELFAALAWRLRAEGRGARALVRRAAWEEVFSPRRLEVYQSTCTERELFELPAQDCYERAACAKGSYTDEPKGCTPPPPASLRGEVEELQRVMGDAIDGLYRYQRADSGALLRSRSSSSTDSGSRERSCSRAPSVEGRRTDGGGTPRERRTVDAETPQTQWHKGGRRRRGPIGP